MSVRRRGGAEGSGSSSRSGVGTAGVALAAFGLLAAACSSANHGKSAARVGGGAGFGAGGGTPAAGQAPHGVELAGSVWPAFEGDGRHSAGANVTGPRTGTVRWTRKLEGEVTPGAVVGADGTIYAASDGGVLHALDAESGADRWTFDGGGSYGEDLSTAPAALAGGTILWPGPHNTLFALDPAGKALWQQRFQSFVLSPLVGTGGRLYVAEMNGRLHAFDLAAEGLHERWVSTLGTHDTTQSSPALGDDGTIYETIGNRMVALRDDGSHATILWHFDIHSGTEVSPAVSRDGVAIFGTNDDFEYGLGRDGRALWRYPRNSLSYSSPAVTADGLAYFGDHNGYMNVVRVADGSLVMRYQGGGEVWTAAAVDRDRNVYFGTKAGHILGFGADGTKLFDLDTGATVDSYPALTADGTLLIGSTNGTLYALHD